MISRELLQKAADNHIIQDEQIAPLMRFLSEQAASPDNATQAEPLRFIRNFGDVFITLGVILLSIAINLIPLSGYLYFVPVIGFIVLAEWLIRVRRLVLPGIAILISTLYFVNKAIEFDHENASIFGLGILCLTSLLFYLRYKLPFSLFPLAAGLIAIALSQIGINAIQHPIIFAGFGFIVFIAAMGFDIRDTARQSQLSDSAFWLHLLAAPLLVHGTMLSLLSSDLAWIQALDKEIIIVALFCVFLLLALLLDRRAILISTQLYMIYALTQILQGPIASTQNSLIYILMTVALLIIFFGTYWYKTRRLIFGFLSTSVISSYVPDLNQRDIKS